MVVAKDTRNKFCFVALMLLSLPQEKFGDATRTDAFLFVFYVCFPLKREVATTRGLADRARLGVSNDPHFIFY